MANRDRELQVLLVEDSPGDVRLTQEALRDATMPVKLHVTFDGVDAMAFLHNEHPHEDAPRPDLILLDLNLPRMNGQEVLAHIKADARLRAIPAVILTASAAEEDIVRSYQLHANCFLSKPVQVDEFESLVKTTGDFWLTKVKLPPDTAEPAQHGVPEITDRPAAAAEGKARHPVLSASKEIRMATQVLLVEDSPGDVRLTREAFRDADISIELHVATDGVEAMDFLRRAGMHASAPRPDLILLDLNLPRMDGREVLAQIKADDDLRTIPTVILTTSDAEADIVESYQLQANCYLTKPVQLDAFESLVQSINDFWLTRVKLPQKTARR